MKGNKKTSSLILEILEILWCEGVFKSRQKFTQITKILEKRGHNFSKLELGLALSRAVFLTRHGKRGSYEYIQRMPAVDKVTKIEKQLFSDELVRKLNKNFRVEVSDLYLNFGKSGTCTAFLLRKILEKLIFLTFAKHNLSDKLKDTNGSFIGLEAMIKQTISEKISGVPFLMPQTAKKIKGIKFLGDTSAHNPLTNVDMETINPQMPYVITAYKELSKKL